MRNVNTKSLGYTNTLISDFNIITFPQERIKLNTSVIKKSEFNVYEYYHLVTQKRSWRIAFPHNVKSPVDNKSAKYMNNNYILSILSQSSYL